MLTPKRGIVISSIKRINESCQKTLTKIKEMKERKKDNENIKLLFLSHFLSQIDNSLDLNQTQSILFLILRHSNSHNQE